jgi:Tfp pilus assembly protein PilN
MVVDKKQFGFGAGGARITGLSQGLKPGLIYGILFLILALLVWLGLFLGQRILERQAANLEFQKQEFLKQRNIPKENLVLAFGDQVKSLEARLKEHSQVSKVLVFLQEITHPQVFYDSLEFSLRDQNLRLQGRAASLEALSEQLTLFKGSDIVEELSLGAVNSVQDGVQFEVQLKLSKASLTGI